MKKVLVIAVVFTVGMLCIPALTQEVTPEVTPKVNALIKASSQNNQEDAGIRQLVVRQLSHIGGEEVTKALIAATTDPIEWVRADAASALAHRKGEDVFNILVNLLSDDARCVRSDATEALAHENHMGAWNDDQLIETLESHALVGMRTAALEVIGKRAREEAKEGDDEIG